MYRTLIFFISLVSLGACSSDNTVTTEHSKASKLSSAVSLATENSHFDSEMPRLDAPPLQKSVIYARAGNEQISQADIDKILELQLFDLEWVKYDLRRKTLARVINDKLERGLSPASSVEIFIEPPMPPRLNIKTHDEQPAYGNKLAPITLSVFCSYPSSHCANMTSTYDELLNSYPEQIRLVFFDFPQAFHVNAGHAARAARCANEGGQFWPYHKGLLANYDQISEALFMRLARQVNLDTKRFKACFETNQYMAEVKANLSESEALGLSKVPVTLINGLFINGPRSVDTLRYFVDKELARLNIAPAYHLQQAQQTAPTIDIPVSKLPLRLEAITLGLKAENSSATIQHFKDNSSRLYKQDDEVLPQIFIVMIDANSVILERAGHLERLILSSGEMASDPASTEGVSDTGNDSNSSENLSASQGSEEPLHQEKPKSLADPEDVPPGLEYTFRGVVSPKGETPLSRSWLNEQLSERETLKTHFEAAEHEVEGVYVMRLTNIKENDFYQTLGLQERDVVLRVNNEWLHSTQNNLFETLENEQEVSVVLMRKGLPVHLNYHIN